MSSPASAWVPLFPEDEIPFILAAILRCSALLKKKHNQEREDRLSNRLRLLIRRDTAYRRSGIRIDREVPVYNEEADQEEPIGRIDFRFQSPQRQTDTDWHFVVEAKRLHVTSKGGQWQSFISKYVTGHQGMKCFIDRRYARDLTNGAMLGYVFDGQVDRAQTAVAAAIINNATPLKSLAPHEPTPSKIVVNCPNIYETTHDLKQGYFTIYHLFVPV